MTRTLLFSAVFALSATCAMAQSLQAPAADNPADAPANGGAGVRSGNITSTGETVPNPGASQSAGTTSLDRGIQQQDNKITSSICKGC
jgi:hypothetical protein